MPIYEFTCTTCNTIYSFRSRTVDTEKRPLCPHCGTDTLSRRISRFAVVKAGRAEGDEDMPDIDESKLESAMATLERDADKLDEKNPRSLADFMRRFSSAAGIRFGEKMEEVLRRLENGEDPDAVEADMGDSFEDENPFEVVRSRGSARRQRPKVDEHLYDL